MTFLNSDSNFLTFFTVFQNCVHVRHGNSFIKKNKKIQFYSEININEAIKYKSIYLNYNLSN